MRFIIGELPEWPFILDYDGNERTQCHLCGGSGVKDGKPCWGLNFVGTIHDGLTPVADGEAEYLSWVPRGVAGTDYTEEKKHGAA